MISGLNGKSQDATATSSALAKGRAVARAALEQLAAKSGWPPNELQFRMKCVERHYRERRRLLGLTEKDDRRAIRRQNRMLNSYAGTLCAFLEELASGKTSYVRPIATKALDEHLRQCRPTRRLHECARLHVQSKANGSKRSVISPGPRARVSQRLVGHVLSARQLANPYEYNTAGRGGNAAVQRLIKLIEEKRLRDLVTFDIENFFASVKPAHLSWLALPPRVMKHSVFFHRNAILLCGKGHLAEAEAARRGLPQGARLSGDTASALLGRELCLLSGAGEIVAYVDDVVIGACSPAGAKNLAEALKMRFGNHPDGPLSFKTIKVVRAEEGFSFLGYWIRLVVDDGEPIVRVKPSHEAKQKLKRGVFRRLADLGADIDPKSVDKCLNDYRDNWRRAFPLWKPDADALLLLELEVLGYADDFFSGYDRKLPVKAHPLLTGVSRPPPLPLPA